MCFLELTSLATTILAGLFPSNIILKVNDLWNIIPINLSVRGSEENGNYISVWKVLNIRSFSRQEPSVLPGPGKRESLGLKHSAPSRMSTFFPVLFHFLYQCTIWGPLGLLTWFQGERQFIRDDIRPEQQRVVPAGGLLSKPNHFLAHARLAGRNLLQQSHGASSPVSHFLKFGWRGIHYIV